MGYRGKTIIAQDITNKRAQNINTEEAKRKIVLNIIIHTGPGP